MVGTWIRLAHVELSSGASTIDSGTFTKTKNLQFVIFTVGGASCKQTVQFNGDSSGSAGSSGNYFYRYRINNDSYNDSVNQVRLIIQGSSTTGNAYSETRVVNIDGQEKQTFMSSMDCADGDENSPDRYKAIGKWTTTSGQIESIKVLSDTGNNFGAGSYITVFGDSDDVVTDEKTTISNVEAGTRFYETDTRKIYRSYAVTNTPTPDTTTSSGNTILKFTDAGSYTFTPSANFNVEYLVVGGGGGGGNENWDAGRGSGGGGAGAYRTATGFSVTSGTSYTVTVGDGGIGGIYKSGGSSSCGTSYEPYLYQGTKGNDSVFGSITSNGGAGGGGHDTAGGNGCETSYGFLENGNASGGGGSNSRSDVAGNTTKGAYGYEGGDGAGSGSNFSGGGGGGSSQLGQDASGGTGGAGGNGTASSITGSSITFSTGGGGHGSSGNGTGGSSNASSNAGVTGSAGNSATSNTGSGGGANSGTSRAGKGGSGIVVLKFSTSGNTFTTNGSMGWKERGSA